MAEMKQTNAGLGRPEPGCPEVAGRLIDGEALSAVSAHFARTVASRMSTQTVLDDLVSGIVGVLPVAAGISLFSSDVPPVAVAVSNAAGLRLEGLQVLLREGPCLDAYRTGRAVCAEDLACDDDRFSLFSARVRQAGVGAVFALPLGRGDNCFGSLALYCASATRLDTETLATAQTLADVAAGYILAARARDDLRAVTGPAQLGEAPGSARTGESVADQPQGRRARRRAASRWTRSTHHGRPDAMTTMAESEPPARTARVETVRPVAAPALQLLAPLPPDDDRREQGAADSAADLAALERCRPHLDALWLMAWLALDDEEAAEQAVVDAMTSAARNPVLTSTGAPGVWAVLAGHIERVRASVQGRLPDAERSRMRRSRTQHEAVALVATGHTPRHVAWLLGLPLTRIHHELRAGLAALRPVAPSPAGAAQPAHRLAKPAIEVDFTSD